MKLKDLNWFKREIHKELESWHGVEGGIDGDGINDIMLLINQLETEVLSQEWIDEHITQDDIKGNGYVAADALYGKLVPNQEDMFNGEEPDEGEVYFAVGLEGAVEVNSASNIDEAIERLAEHETNYNILKKPVIPKFVDDYIKWYEKSFIYTFDTDAEYIISLLQVPFDFVGCERVKEWRDKFGNAQKLIDAYRWGYEVEERELTVKEVIGEHIELLKRQEVAVNLKPYYALWEELKDK